MKKKGLHIALWSLIVTSSLVLFGFAMKQQKDASCWKMDINVQQLEGMYFIDSDAVRRSILNLGDPIIGSDLDKIDLTRIRKTILKLPSVKTASVYSSVDGCLHVDVSQRFPIARIWNQDGSSYYLDKEGFKMPLSQSYTARVPIVKGEFIIPIDQKQASNIETIEENKRELIDEIYTLVSYVENDEFLSAQVEHFSLNEDNDFEIIPRIGAHRIVVGDASDLEEKFSNLKSFYAATVEKGNLNIYKRINLKYRGQVVGEKYF